MPSVFGRLFARTSSRRVGEITLDAGDVHSVQQAKLAQVALAQMRQFVILLDGEGHVLEISAGALERAALTRADAVGTAFWDLPLWAAKAPSDGVRRTFARAQAGQPARLELRPGHGRGGLGLRLRPLHDAAGQIALFVLENDESAERDDLARKFRMLRQQLERMHRLDRQKRDNGGSPEQQLAGSERIQDELASGRGQLRRMEAQLQALRDALAVELAAMTQLHDFSMQTPGSSDLQPLLEQVMNATMALHDADFGNVQIYDAAQGTLHTLAQRGFGPEFVKRFEGTIDPASACGRALAERRRIVIEDVELDPDFAPLRALAAESGFRAVQSTPLLTHAGEALGVLSTHFRTPHRPSDAELRLTDLYARVVADALERRRAEAERSKLAALVENSADLIAIASLDGQLIFLNRAGQQLLGLGEGQQLDRPFAELIAEQDRERFEQQIWPRAAREGRWDGQVSFRHFKGADGVPMLQHIFFIRDAGSGQPLALGTISRDDRERMRAQEALRHAHNELAHATRVMSLGELTATIAHEVNQPLAAIVTNGHACLRWLGRGPPDVGEARSAVERMLRDGRRASEVIDRIRSLSAKTERRKSLVDVHELIDETLALIQYEVVRLRVHVKLELNAVRSSIWGDRIQLQQVLLNLAMNGVEAMRDVEERRRDLHIASSLAEHGMLALWVRDSGVGLDRDALERLFEPFYTTKPEGIGLGLSISQRIVTAHGGSLSATPNRDHGLTLKLTLPLES